MDNHTLTIISLLCLVIGLLGSVLPALPGSVLSWLGLVAFKYTSYATYDWPTLIICAMIVIGVQLISYFLPGIGSKKMGGSKYSNWGATLGLLVGIIFAPFGLISIIIVPFIGAFLGEFLFVNRDINIAIKAAFGSFIGVMISNGLNLMLCLSFLIYVMWQLSQNAGWNWF
ncbi:DUF456 family protein [Flavobacteriaceae bacterium Ap0902]|nr:DUF456 family protein [Flavobacteriaceae bacterium Ap0902]